MNVLKKEIQGWYQVSVTGWIVFSSYIFSGAFTLSEIYERQLYESVYDPALWMTFLVIVMLVARVRGHQPFAVTKQEQKGFSLIELIIVISIIGILSTIALGFFNGAREKAYFARAEKEFRTMEQAIHLYLNDHDGVYPDDVNRGLPPGLEEYLATDGEWPDAPWPGSVYDWENWDIDGVDTYQISIRFCDDGTCNFPDEEWAENFDTYSSVFYCFEGTCKSHTSRDFDHPGYCVNCQEPDIIRGD